eukprot:scaffold280303_cov32-Tisochrysis_lutea.AAC.3
MSWLRRPGPQPVLRQCVQRGRMRARSGAPSAKKLPLEPLRQARAARDSEDAQLRPDIERFGLCVERSELHAEGEGGVELFVLELFDDEAA